MRVHTEVVLDMTAPLPGGGFKVVSEKGFDYRGPVAECKGDSTAKASEQAQASFTNTLQQSFAQQFANQSNVLNFLNGKLTAQVNNPQGYTPAQMAALNTQAIQGTAQQYQNASQAANQAIAARGGNGLPSGVNAQIQGQLAQGAANTESSALMNNQINNANLQQQNYWNALNGLSGVASQYNPNGFAGSANSGAGEVANLSNAYTNSNQSQLLGALGGVVGGAAGGFFQGGFGKLLGGGGSSQGSSQG
jgi:hypothetical protein